MGIRFLCPNGHKLNVKSGLAGKRASCPECGAKLLVPVASAEPKAPPAAIVVNAPPPSGVWYLRTASGQQLGPATEDQFSGWIADGLVTANSHAWREGWAEWKRVRDVSDVLPAPLAAIPVLDPETASVEIPVEESVPQPVTAATVEERAAVDAQAKGVAELDAAAAEPIALETDVKGAALPTAATYALRKRRSKKMQLTLAVAMLVAVIVLAGVLVWVIQNNATAVPPVSYLNIFDYSNALPF
jgi:hypothetical protein